MPRALEDLDAEYLHSESRYNATDKEAKYERTLKGDVVLTRAKEFDEINWA